MTPDELASLAERGWFIRDGFAGEPAAQAARVQVAALDLRAAHVGGERIAGVRGDEIAWIDHPVLRGRFESLKGDLNREAFLGLARFDLQAAHYSPGAAYPRHRDALRGERSRRVTAIWYLSSGGLLRLHLDPPLDVEPRVDRLVVFLSEEIEHEVLPGATGRWAITAWYY